MALIAHLTPIEDVTGERRGAPRLLLSLGASLRPCLSEVTIHNLSVTGLLLETSADLKIGETIQVQLPEMDPAAATVVWRDGSSYGCQFERPMRRAGLSAALLRSEPPGRAADGAVRLDAFGRDYATGPQRLWRRIAAFVVLLAISGLGIAAAVAAPAVAALVFIALLVLLVLWGIAILDGTRDLDL
ncbi:MAG TPA: PilZ domain-containing protein [Sphingomicrobium sp.]|nr:PilZ domain-containing protein [Sphingomicrobium sp.]